MAVAISPDDGFPNDKLQKHDLLARLRQRDRIIPQEAVELIMPAADTDGASSIEWPCERAAVPALAVVHADGGFVPRPGSDAVKLATTKRDTRSVVHLPACAMCCYFLQSADNG